MLLSCKTCLHAAVLTGLPRILPGPQGPSPALQLPGVRRLILAHTGRQVPHDLFGHPSSRLPLSHSILLSSCTTQCKGDLAGFSFPPRVLLTFPQESPTDKPAPSGPLVFSVSNQDVSLLTSSIFPVKMKTIPHSCSSSLQHSGCRSGQHKQGKAVFLQPKTPAQGLKACICSA